MSEHPDLLRIGTAALELGPGGSPRSPNAGPGAGTAALWALFMPSESPVVTVWPPACLQAQLATRWALRVLGQGHRGGELRVVWNGPPDAWWAPAAESVVAVSAVDDAVAGGHRIPVPGRPGRSSRLADRLLADDEELRSLAAATGLELSRF